MGHTHYARFAPADQSALDTAYGDFRPDIERLCWIAGLEGIVLGDAFGEGRFVATPDVVAFNGANGQDYESFYWERMPADTLWFCKTGFFAADRRPYDAVVVAALVLAAHHYGAAVSISTDATPEELADGFKLLRRCWPLRQFPDASVFGA